MLVLAAEQSADATAWDQAASLAAPRAWPRPPLAPARPGAAGQGPPFAKPPRPRAPLCDPLNETPFAGPRPAEAECMPGGMAMPAEWLI